MCFCKSIGQGDPKSNESRQADDRSDDRIQEQEVARHGTASDRLLVGDDGNVRSTVIPFTGVLYPFV